MLLIEFWIFPPFDSTVNVDIAVELSMLLDDDRSNPDLMALWGAQHDEWWWPILGTGMGVISGDENR